MLRRPVENDVALVDEQDGRDLRTQLALEPFHARSGPVQLVLESQHVQNACES